MGDDAIYNAIFHFFSQPMNYGNSETCHYGAVSRWVYDSLLEVCETREADAAANLNRKLFRGVLGRRPPGPSVREEGVELIEWH